MNRNVRHVPRTLAALTFASTLALAALGIAGVSADPAARARPLVGEFTGEVVAEGPVYRLPAIHIVANRSAELARIEREERGVAAHVSERAPAPFVPLLVKEVA
jgi:hypothetical protein